MGKMLNEQQQDIDFQFYVNNREALYKQYAECVLIISHGEVLGKFDDKYTAVTETMKTRDLGTFIVQSLSDSDNCYMGSVGGAYL